MSEQFLNSTSAQYRLCSAILLKLQRNLSIYNRFENNSSRDESKETAQFSTREHLIMYTLLQIRNCWQPADAVSFSLARQ